MTERLESWNWVMDNDDRRKTDENLELINTENIWTKVAWLLEVANSDEDLS